MGEGDAVPRHRDRRRREADRDAQPGDDQQQAEQGAEFIGHAEWPGIALADRCFWGGLFRTAAGWWVSAQDEPRMVDDPFLILAA